jgi:6-methylsalicylate decarboxylase
LGIPDSLIDFTADTTRVVAQMLYSNRFSRTPNVKYIFSHAGGAIPYLAGRFAIVDEMNVVPGGEIRGTAAATLRRLYYDTALSFSPPVLNMLRDVVGLTQVVFGTDNPYLRRDLAVRSAEHMRRTTALSEAERQAILQRNAQRLFPRLSHVLVA